MCCRFCAGGETKRAAKAALVLHDSVTVTAVLLAVVVTQVVADGTTGRATQAGTDGRAGRAANLAAQQRATGRAQATADGGFGTVALACTHGAAGRPAQAGTDGRTGAAAHLFADNVTQGATQATANGGSTVTGESALAQQQTKGKGRQSQTHDRSLGRIIRLCVEGKDVSTVIAVTVATIIIVAIMPLVVTVAAIAIAPATIVIAVMMVVAAGNEQ